MAMNKLPSDDELDALVLDHLENLSIILDLNHHLEDSLISATSYNLNEMSSRGASFRAAVIEEPLEPVCDTNFKTVRFQLIDELASNKWDSSPSADPIRWFSGVLVPSSLRHAQSCFRRAVNLSLELASRRAKLEASSQQIKHLIKLRTAADLAT
ncbi:unnamed protein product [Trichobilharzia regenti]|nr:unnamed protein product [Trichobilharzia regenti]